MLESAETLRVYAKAILTIIANFMLPAAVALVVAGAVIVFNLIGGLCLGTFAPETDTTVGAVPVGTELAFAPITGGVFTCRFPVCST
jgi:hypothetical protein